MKYKKILIFVLIIVVVLLLNLYFGWSTYIFDGSAMEYMNTLIKENYLPATLVYLVLTIIGTSVLAVPGVSFAIISGALFGPIIGTILCSLGATIGAILAFLAGRYFLKDTIKPIVMNNSLIKKWLFEENKKNDIFLLMITRLIPIFPFNIQNFAYGITDISLGTYSLFTFVFIIPGTAMYTLGTAGVLSNDNKVMLFLTAIVIGIGVFLIGYILKKKYIKPSEVVFFPGCNFYALYPKTTKKIEDYFKARGIDRVYKCCRNKDILSFFNKLGIKRIITACPNCYYHLQKNEGIEVVSLYTEIDESIKCEIEGEIYVPCPDRNSRKVLDSISKHVSGYNILDYNYCCGYGDYTKDRKFKLKENFINKLKPYTERVSVYTYCATCSLMCAKEKVKVMHILARIFDTREKPKLKGYRYRWLRIKSK